MWYACDHEQVQIASDLICLMMPLWLIWLLWYVTMATVTTMVCEYGFVLFSVKGKQCLLLL